MDRGFYTSVSAMMCGSKKLGDIANNIANINTVGYKKDKSTITQFSDLVINKMDENVYVGNLQSQVNMDETFTIFTAGNLSVTDLENDRAIIGEGFFKIERENDYAYTRDGSFKVDRDGYLVTNDGYYVMDKDNKRILVEEGIDYTDNIQVVDFDNYQTLERTSGNLFINKFNVSQEEQVENPMIKKGILELSNVDASEELTDMITTQRYFQFNQRSLSVRDELLEKIAQF